MTSARSATTQPTKAPAAHTWQNIRDLASIFAANHDYAGVHARAKSVVHIVPSFAWGGAERMACTIHRLALERGWKSQLFSLPLIDIDQGLYEEGVLSQPPSRIPPSTYAPVKPQTRQELLRAWVAHTRQRVLQANPSVIHAHLPYPDRAGAALMIGRGFSKVLSFQLLPGLTDYWSLDELFGWRSDNVLSRIGSRMKHTRFVAPSDEDVQRIEALVGVGKVSKVQNCPALPRVNLPPQTPFEWKPSVVRLLSVGRLVEHKGFVPMIEALAQEPTRSLNWQWVIAGEGPEREHILQRAKELQILDRIALEGPRPGQSLYPVADLVLCPSEQEGYPLVPLEAVEAKTAVVVSAIAPHQEQFAAVPESVLPKDKAQWSTVLAKWIGNEGARKMLQNTQQTKLPSDPRKTTMDGYERLYR